ncbi:26S proteasome regulatory subunit rnp-8 [Rhodotorula toruloides]|uniref:26S proteasome regulatory subunit rnp-8 n=1 Tax=Rhodotorula toruloides TaxID=5286 RepID=A0A511KPP7_RHOTO|nr:26S proteasome regulatory subunit rnp-8 [Rhodotorula toruloides]
MATTTPTLLTLSTQPCHVHPLVLLSVQDHFHRVAKNTRKRVVGILLGQELGKGGWEVTNSFAVPFEEDEKDPRTWFLDHNYIEAMNDMFKKVNAREKLIGWYHTGPRLRASDLEINAVVKRYTQRPIMVIVDVRPDEERAGGGGGIPTDAYVAVEEIKDDGTASQHTFIHVPSLISASEAEEIGVEHLLRDISSTALTTGSLSTRVSSQLSSLRGLGARLVEIRDYLEEVVEGKLGINQQIVANLQDVFNLLPNLEAAVQGGMVAEEKEVGEGAGARKRPFTVATNDQLLVMYLSSLIRTVIALHDLVLNKQAAAAAADGEVEEQETSADKKDGDKGEKKDEKSDKEKAKEWFKGDEKGH